MAWYLRTTLIHLVATTPTRRSKFVEVTCIAYKDKVAPGTFDPPPKRARRIEEIHVLPPLPLLLEASGPSNPPTDFSARGASPPPSQPPSQNYEEADTGAPWPRGIQHLALSLTR